MDDRKKASYQILAVQSQFSSYVLKMFSDVIFMYKANQQEVLKLLTVLNSKQWYALRKLKLLKRQRFERKSRSIWVKPGRTNLWWENVRNGVAHVDVWKKNFRLTRDLFYELLNKLEPHIRIKGAIPNTRALDAENKLASVLYFLKDMPLEYTNLHYLAFCTKYVQL